MIDTILNFYSTKHKLHSPTCLIYSFTPSSRQHTCFLALLLLQHKPNPCNRSFRVKKRKILPPIGKHSSGNRYQIPFQCLIRCPFYCSAKFTHACTAKILKASPLRTCHNTHILSMSVIYSSISPLCFIRCYTIITV